MPLQKVSVTGPSAVGVFEPQADADRTAHSASPTATGILSRRCFMREKLQSRGR
jgi:hypothetical protein